MFVLLGKPHNPHLPTNYAVANIICSLVFGHRFEYTDKKFQMLMKMFDKSIEIEASIWAEVMCKCSMITSHCFLNMFLPYLIFSEYSDEYSG